MTDITLIEAWKPHLNERFLITAEDGHSFGAILQELKALPDQQRPGTDASLPARVAFSAILRVQDGLRASQGIFALGHPGLGELGTIFLVAIGEDEQGRYYEAVFN